MPPSSPILTARVTKPGKLNYIQTIQRERDGLLLLVDEPGAKHLKPNTIISDSKHFCGGYKPITMFLFLLSKTNPQT